MSPFFILPGGPVAPISAKERLRGGGEGVMHSPTCQMWSTWDPGSTGVSISASLDVPFLSNTLSQRSPGYKRTRKGRYRIQKTANLCVNKDRGHCWSEFVANYETVSSISLLGWDSLARNSASSDTTLLWTLVHANLMKGREERWHHGHLPGAPASI